MSSLFGISDRTLHPGDRLVFSPQLSLDMIVQNHQGPIDIVRTLPAGYSDETIFTIPRQVSLDVELQIGFIGANDGRLDLFGCSPRKSLLVITLPSRRSRNQT